MKMTEEARQELLEEAKRYDEFDFNLFEAEYGWADWMDIYFEDSDYPKDSELEEIKKDMQKVFSEAQKIKKGSVINLWRSRAGLTIKEMSRIFNIPERTIENWSMNKNFPAEWTIELLVDKLINYTEESYEKKMKKIANGLKSDEDGKRPVMRWAVLNDINSDTFIELYDDMRAAMKDAEKGETIACILANEDDESWYHDKNYDSNWNYEAFEI